MIAATTIGAALREATAALDQAGIANPNFEARLLLSHAAGVTRETLLRDGDAAIDAALFSEWVARRVAREPIAYILGRREFWSLDLAVSSATLIPRADSETLIEAAMAALPDRQAVTRVLDLGTGTGCLLLAALTEFPRAFGVGVDRSPAAAALAHANATRTELAGRCAMLCGDWAAALAGRFDLVLANPPYIATAELPTLMPELDYEPRLALDGGADGLDCYRRIVAMLPHLLASQGCAVLEVGFGQADQLAAIAQAVGLAVPEIRADLAGVPRAMVLRRPG